MKGQSATEECNAAHSESSSMQQNVCCFHEIAHVFRLVRLVPVDGLMDFFGSISWSALQLSQILQQLAHLSSLFSPTPNLDFSISKLSSSSSANSRLRPCTSKYMFDHADNVFAVTLATRSSCWLGLHSDHGGGHTWTLWPAQPCNDKTWTARLSCGAPMCGSTETLEILRRSARQIRSCWPVAEFYSPWPAAVPPSPVQWCLLSHLASSSASFVVFCEVSFFISSVIVQVLKS